MSELNRRRRSALYVPGANERALTKAATLPVDVLILDLEDAVAPDAKVAARDRVCEFARRRQQTARELVVRINGRSTPWHVDDLRAVSAARLDAILLPKVNSARDIQEAEEALDAAHASTALCLWAMLETPAAILQAAAIAFASSRLVTLVLGTNDLTKELRAQDVPGRQPLWFAMQTCLLAARAAGKDVLDGVCNQLADTSRFEAECRQAREFGFDGKTLIHPSQVEPCHRIFAPSADEVRFAREVIAAFDAAGDGAGVVRVAGQMVERLHLEWARRILAWAS